MPSDWKIFELKFVFNNYRLQFCCCFDFDFFFFNIIYPAYAKSTHLPPVSVALIPSKETSHFFFLTHLPDFVSSTKKKKKAKKPTHKFSMTISSRILELWSQKIFKLRDVYSRLQRHVCSPSSFSCSQKSPFKTTQ